MKKITLLLFAVSCLFFNEVLAQCQPTQSQAYIQIETDQYGHEGYWELVPAGNPCGVGTIFSGVNISQVGCNGANGRDATQGNGYNNHRTITEGPWCLCKLPQKLDSLKNEFQFFLISKDQKNREFMLQLS